MSKLRCDISVSVDGFVAGPNQSEENPLGEGSEVNESTRLRDEFVTAGSGEPVFAPRGVPHTFANLTDGPAHQLIVCTPAGFERYFARIAAERQGVDPPERALRPIPEVTR